MSETISTSVSAAAIFSDEESWGRPPKRKDMMSCYLALQKFVEGQSVLRCKR